ncbi:MAG: hypothetical protein QGI68_19555 [Pseudomonadales bacterium]|nr:hypothetical protein [Pseudomonadales bacterium]HJN52372.1 hypothetical protein [Pseudomonadales bacterium]
MEKEPSYTTGTQSRARCTFTVSRQNVPRHTASCRYPTLDQLVPMMLKPTASDRPRASHLSGLLANLASGAVASRPGRRCCRSLNAVFFRRNTEHLARLIQKIMGESPAQAKQISADWMLYRQLSRRCWQSMADSSYSRVRSNALTSLFPHKSQVVRYIQNCDRGVLIASIHMGDYLHGLLHLCLSASSRREVFILRNRSWTIQEERAFQKFSNAGVTVTVLRRHRNVAIQAVRQLRRGNIVVALYDLSSQWGSTTRVTFFDHEMALVRGPAELAILAKADILPIMFHYATDGTPVIDSFPVYRSPPLRSVSLEATAQQVTQHLVTQAEWQIRQFPGQWHHWHLLPAMLADG